MASPSGWSGSTNLISGPDPHYHHALIRRAAEPIARAEDDGSVRWSWHGQHGVQLRRRFTVDDLIDYYYDAFGVVSPKLRRATRSADRGAVASLLNEMSLDELLFAIDLMAEDAAGASQRRPLIAASEFLEGAMERLAIAQGILSQALPQAEGEGVEPVAGGARNRPSRGR